MVSDEFRTWCEMLDHDLEATSILTTIRMGHGNSSVLKLGTP